MDCDTIEIWYKTMNMIILKKNVEDFICPFLPFSISTLIYGVKFHCSNFIQGFYDLKKSPGEQFREQEVLALSYIAKQTLYPPYSHFKKQAGAELGHYHAR